VFNELKRSLESDGPSSSLWAAMVESEYRSVVRSIFRWVPGREHYVLITSCSDIVDFLKSSKTDLAIRFIHDSYRGRARV
jgi:hypothetical protein